GGGCRGIGFRIAAEQVRTELTLLWRREMLGGTYDARWVQADIGGQRSRALTFVANRRHPRYAGALQPEEAMRHIATAAGSLGSCRAYFDQTVAALERLGIRDAAIERLRAALAQLPPAPPAAIVTRDGPQTVAGPVAAAPSLLSNP
ncbi:MAG TPA: gamma-glutamylcyclotransferase, partial [Burkholderiaceae bacterium]|nr:gamma-glutamylcyclotransferase [Burkholderiaceae bacterium]